MGMGLAPAVLAVATEAMATTIAVKAAVLQRRAPFMVYLRGGLPRRWNARLELVVPPQSSCRLAEWASRGTLRTTPRQLASFTTPGSDDPCRRALGNWA